MRPDLYRDNSPDRFWRLTVVPAPTSDDWSDAVAYAARILPPECRTQGDDVPSILDATLGEGQFGADHWRLGHATRTYYALKPLLPRAFTRRLKRLFGGHRGQSHRLGWPVEDRYARFLFEVARHIARLQDRPQLPFIDFWPDGHRYAFVLTHDIETATGQSFALRVAELDASFGFRSAFNFVPERYAVDHDLIAELRERGFEVGVHGLRHDGRDFGSRTEFARRATLINRFAQETGAVGFRAPLTHRHPVWMQELDFEWDSSFFDADPYEPIAGGTMSIWPFQLGRFIELPYTLAQDYTLVEVLGERSPRLWVDKVEFIRANHGMALLNAHPDYLRKPRTWSVYSAFLETMARQRDHYHALPFEVARWWRARLCAEGVHDLPSAVLACIGADGEISRAEPASQSDRCASHTEDARSSGARTA